MVGGWWFACGPGPAAGEHPEVQAAWAALTPTQLPAAGPPPIVVPPGSGAAQGATWKLGPGTADVWVTADGQVVPGASVELSAGGVVSVQVTDDRGLARFDGLPPAVGWTARVGGAAAVDLGVGPEPGPEVRVHTVADRVAARPGDPVRVRSTFRLATAGGLERSRGEVRWLLTDPAGDPVDVGDGALDEWGGVSLEAQLPADAVDGDWLVSVLAVGDRWSAVARAPVRVGGPVEVAPVPAEVPPAPPSGDLALVAESDALAVGDTARIRIDGEPGVAWVTVEREGVLGSQVVVVPGVVEIPVVSAHRPNVWVSAVRVDRSGARLGRIRLAVDPEPERLSVEVTPRGGSVRRPGEEVSVDVLVTRGGQPVPDAAVTLFAVDPRAAAPVSDPFDLFHASRGLGVSTVDPRLPAAAPVGGPHLGSHLGAAGFIAVPGVSSRWHEGRTGPDGGATAAFVVPQPPAELRIYAVVSSGSAAFGLGAASLGGGGARLTAPSWLRVGDMAFAQAELRNPADRAARLSVDLTAAGGVTAVGDAELDVPARGSGSVRVKVGAAEPGGATLELVAGGDHAAASIHVEPAPAAPPAASPGLVIERTLSRIGGAGPVEVGAEIVVTLSVITDAARDDVAVSEPIPAGFEWSGPGEGSPDLLGERVGAELWLRAARLPAGPHTWQYRLRALTPGVYTHPPAIVRAGEATVHTGPGAITVGPAGGRETSVEPVHP